MSNELTVKKESVLTVIDEKGIGEVIRPLINEIHLFDTYIAGTSYLKDKEPLKRIREGDRLTLKREDNPYDDKAIVVLDSENGKLGYVPERDNVVFSRLMDAGKHLTAKVLTVKNQEYFTKISMAIFLVDY
jgi:hypothetical protein